MMNRVKNAVNLFKNMGWRYMQFRIRHELKRRTGLLKKEFPVKPLYKQYVHLQQWKDQDANFFFTDKESLQIPKGRSFTLRNWFQEYKNGKLIFFSSTTFELGKNYDWITNPDTGYTYDINKHWTEINEFSKEHGDIKYVWEKSRFSFLYNIIRYDYHFEEDCAEIVFAEIIDWIKNNPINCGPNYVCSQEISLRVLNWTFALYYYKQSRFLTENVFNQIQHAIYWQMNHVYSNINFSRIAVRNNHAITETLALYLVGLLYPMFPGASKWKRKGKSWFEQEIAYQIYEDGTYLQFSMNYHRVVIQLLSWAIALAEKNKEQFKPVVYERAKRSLHFLRVCMNDSNGSLPNYGANDGALFFPFNDVHFRDYRPQLQAIACILKIDIRFPFKYEDVHWYNINNSFKKEEQINDGIYEFKKGGFFIMREEDSLTFIRCGKHKDRPSHADNLHLDIWYKGRNILIDAGSYKYNTDEQTLKYFMGTSSHNTVMLSDYDQMLKGERFIWYHWSQSINGQLQETKEEYRFEGTISAFKYVANNILHKREIIKLKGKPIWTIKDTIINKPESIVIKQLWHLPLEYTSATFKSMDERGAKLIEENGTAYVSELYGKKEPSQVKIFKTQHNTILTEFQIND